MSVNITVDKDGQKRVEIPFSLIKSLNEAVEKATCIDHATDGVFRLKVSENMGPEWAKGCKAEENASHQWCNIKT